MKAKNIKNWRVVSFGNTFSEAINVLNSQKLGDLEGPFAIQNEVTKKIMTVNDWQENVTLHEASHNWYILVPDTDKEAKNKKIREMLKESGCIGFKWDKIDEMTITDIWNSVKTFHLDGDCDKQYKMLKFFFENKVYKKNN